MTVAVDANGADLGAAEVAAGAAMAAARGTRVLLFGPAPQMGPPSDWVRVVDAPVSVAKAPDAAAAVRATPAASIVQAARAVAAGEADALVSGGSTGAALAAGVSIVKRARGIHRPALAVVVPVPGAPTLNECPQCHKPRRPHRVCPSCGFYAGREVVSPADHHHHDHEH